MYRIYGLASSAAASICHATSSEFVFGLRKFHKTFHPFFVYKIIIKFASKIKTDGETLVLPPDQN